MPKNKLTWIIKNEKGQLKGPYETSKVLELISSGHFDGTEMIASYPDGKWMQISKEPQFYDKLMEALEQASRPGVEDIPDQNSQQQTQIISRKGTQVKSDLNGEKTKAAAPVEIILEKTKATDSKSKNQEPPKSATIELNKISKIKQEAMLKKSLMPGVFLVVLVAVLFWFLFSGEKQSSEKIALLAPKKNGTPLSNEDARRKIASAVVDIEKDTLENYVQAQNKLVAVVEGVPSNLEVRALLCLVYRELWPFAKQDAEDIRIINSVTQSTRNLNVTSAYGNVCEAVKLFTSGRQKEARGVVDNLMDNVDNFSLLPVIYTFKAEMLENERDYANAEPFYEKASQLWDKWLKPQVELAYLQIKTKNYAKAYANLDSALKKNPEHKVSKIGLGKILYYGYQRNEEALSVLESSLRMKGKINKAIEAEANFILANLSLDQGNKPKALKFAEQAYKLNSQDEKIREILVRLGGSEKAHLDPSQKSELIFLGEQYVRQGDCFSAQAQFKAAYDIDKSNGVAAMKAAKCLWQLNQSQEAIQWLNKAIKAEPKLVSAYVLLSDYFSQRFNFNAATQILQQAQKHAQNNYEIYRGMATIEFRKNNVVGAIQYAQKAAKVFEGDVETFILLSKANLNLSVSIIPQSSKDAEAKTTAAKEAISYAARAIEIDGTNSDANINYAKVLAATQGTETGLNWIRELIKKYAYTYEYRIGMAEILKSVERYTQAKDVYEQVADADPKNKKAFLGLGECYKAMGENEKALKALLTAAVLDPSDAEALFQLGMLYLDSRKYADAIKQFRRVEATNPYYPRTYYFMGRAAFFAGDLESALKAAKEEKNRNPNLSDPFILTAEIYQAKRQYVECASEYSLAIKMKPFGADIYVKAAQCYRQSGSLEVAEDMLALAATKENGFAEIYREQGALYEAKGDIRGAVKSYRTYLELSPNALDKKEIETRILKLGG